ncbi:MAG: small subunit ribosomal protein [Patescibacteria group bacterium]|nr:small subunit ribosomal protein [Patescibacteria group bacterium]
MNEVVKNSIPAAGAAKPADGRQNRGRGRGPGTGGQQGGNRGGDRRGGGGRGGAAREPREFEQKILELARVTRVTKGGKRMRFRASLVIGDRRGRVGFGVAKGGDVSMAIEKAFRQAKKNMVKVPFVNETIPHEIFRKFAAASVLLKPAPQGTGLKSGGPTRVVLELAGVPNAVSKIMGSKNKINNAKATFLALRALRMPTEAMLEAKKSKKASA